MGRASPFLTLSLTRYFTLNNDMHLHARQLRYGTIIMSKNLHPASAETPKELPKEIQAELPWTKLCGVSRSRTDDPLLAKQVLYQLSYNPA